MNDLVAQLKQLETDRSSFEQAAVHGEQQARECRAKMAETKQRIAELRCQINDAAGVKFLEETAAAAQRAAVTAEASRTECAAALTLVKQQLDSLKAKDEQYAAKLQEIEGTLARLNAQE